MSDPAAYASFARFAAGKGYAKAAPESTTIIDQVTVDVQGGVAGSDTGAPARKVFFTGDVGNPALRTQDPLIKSGSGIGKDLLIGIHKVGLVFHHMIFAGALTPTLLQMRETLGILNASTLILTAGSDKVLEERGCNILQGDRGYSNTSDTATATGAMRTSIDSFSEGVRLWGTRVIANNAQLKCELLMNVAAWTSTVDFVLELNLFAWIAREGQPVAGSVGLSY